MLNSPVASMLRSESLRPVEPKSTIGGWPDATVKNECGARFGVPSALRVPTQAIGRGMRIDFTSRVVSASPSSAGSKSVRWGAGFWCCGAGWWEWRAGASECSLMPPVWQAVLSGTGQFRGVDRPSGWVLPLQLLPHLPRATGAAPRRTATVATVRRGRPAHGGPVGWPGPLPPGGSRAHGHRPPARRPRAATRPDPWPRAC